MNPLLIPALIMALLTVIVWYFSRAENRTRNLILLAAVGAFITTAAACTPGPTQIIQEITTIVSGLIPIAAAVGSALFPAESAAIEAGAGIAVAGLQELEKIVAEYQSTPTDTNFQKALDAFTVVQKHIADLETAAQVKDPAVRARITAVITGAQQSLALLESSIAARHAGKAANYNAQQGGA
ncbi:MAG: hypothetical protein KGJ13_06115 [Patescibacteria group bacterium]|nr:hypothetical protein [Patescibacteria group bacterium]